MTRLLAALAALMILAAPARAQTPEQFRQDALAIEALVNARYAYLERLPDAALPLSARLRAEAEAVRDAPSLLRYAERALFTLADHHAITGASFGDS